MSRVNSPLRRRLRRRAKITITLTAALVVFAQALGIKLLQGTPQLRDPRYHARADLFRKATAGEERPFALVVLGSSRTQHGFAPLTVGLDNRLSAALGRPAVAFNFGVQGSGPLTHDIYLRRLLRTGPRPDAVYLEVTPTVLTGVDADPRELQTHSLNVRSLTWDELTLLEHYGCHGMRTEWRKTRAKVLWEYRFPFVESVIPAWVPRRCSARLEVPADARGWTALELDDWPEAMRRDALPRARRDHGRAVSEANFHPATLAALRSICETCSRESIRLSIVILPEGPSFRALYSPEVEAQFGKLIQQLSTEFGVPIVNARYWIDEAEFIDGHHLLATGAKRFTARFAEEAVLPQAAGWRAGAR